MFNQDGAGGASNGLLASILPSLQNRGIDTGYLMGLTYSNYERRESVMVIGPTSSYREFANSLLHETRHLTDHVCLAMGMEIGEEPIAYLAGYIGSALADEIRLFVCDCCHEEERKRIINGKKKKHTQGTRRFYKT